VRHATIFGLVRGHAARRAVLWALASLPDGLLRPIVRADSEFFDAKLARAALSLDCDDAIAVKRTDPVCRESVKVQPRKYAVVQRPASGATRSVLLLRRRGLPRLPHETGATAVRADRWAR